MTDRQYVVTFDRLCKAFWITVRLGSLPLVIKKLNCTDTWLETHLKAPKAYATVARGTIGKAAVLTSLFGLAIFCRGTEVKILLASGMLQGLHNCVQGVGVEASITKLAASNCDCEIWSAQTMRDQFVLEGLGWELLLSCHGLGYTKSRPIPFQFIRPDLRELI